jgi:AmmeMemoRadiSam system protein B
MVMAQGQAASVSYVRAPAVAGRFYPDDPRELRLQVDELLEHAATGTPRDALVIVAPHAGYVYSGEVAARAYANTVIPRRVVVVAVNHTGRGAHAAILGRGAMAIPGGTLPVDEPLAQAALGASRDLVEDTRAFELDHSIEVHLPFLRARRPDVQITPITLSGLSYSACRDLGLALAQAMEAAGDGEPVLLVVSSDMSHYLPDEEARRRDRIAIERVVALDPGGLYEAVEEHDISMCGYVPATVAMTAALARGANRGELLAHATSGDVNRDRSAVVGYAALSLRRDDAAIATKAPAAGS